MNNKYIAPVIITAITVLYTLGMCAFLFWAMAEDPLPFWAVMLILGIPILTAVVFIVALLQRIKEIKGGEEDVASKY